MINPWTIFWMVVLLMVIWWCRKLIGIGIVIVLAGICTAGAYVAISVADLWKKIKS